MATIVVAEDSPPLLVLFVETLGAAGYRTLAASSGDEALDYLRSEQHVDLLLTNSLLPGATGDELVRALEVLHPGARAIRLSGQAPEQVRLREGDVFLQKPIALDDLLASVARSLAYGA